MNDETNSGSPRSQGADSAAPAYAALEKLASEKLASEKLTVDNLRVGKLTEKVNPVVPAQSGRRGVSKPLLMGIGGLVIVGILGLAIATGGSRGSSTELGVGPTLLAALAPGATRAPVLQAESTVVVSADVTSDTIAVSSEPDVVVAPSAEVDTEGDVVFGDEVVVGSEPSLPAKGVPAKTVPVKASAPTVCGIVRVMPLGDSLTAYPESYRGPLFRALVAANFKVDFVGSSKRGPDGGGDPDHQGHGGYRIGPDPKLDSDGNLGNLADNVEKWVPAAKPDVIVLNIGTNDLAGGGDLAAAAPKNLTNLIAKLRQLAPNAIVVAGGLPPNGWVPEGDAAMRAVGSALVAAAAADATNVIYVPVFDNMTKAGFDPTPGAGTTDKTHFSVAGGEAFAKALEPSVIDAVKRAQERQSC
jgi:lysophospholipase L1-like esterase